MMKKESYSVNQAARKLRVSRQALHKAIRSGRLRAVQVVTHAWRIPVKVLKQFEVSVSHQQRGKKES